MHPNLGSVASSVSLVSTAIAFASLCTSVYFAQRSKQERLASQESAKKQADQYDSRLKLLQKHLDEEVHQTSEMKAHLLEIGKQTAEMKAQNKLLVYATITERVFSVNQLFISDPGLRKYFYNGCDLKPTKDVQSEQVGYYKAESVAEYILDFCSSLCEFERLFKDNSTFDQTNIKWDEWKRYVSDTLASSPLLCRLLLKHRSWYEDGLWTMAPFHEDELLTYWLTHINEDDVDDETVENVIARINFSRD